MQVPFKPQFATTILNCNWAASSPQCPNIAHISGCNVTVISGVPQGAKCSSKTFCTQHHLFRSSSWMLPMLSDDETFCFRIFFWETIGSPVCVCLSHGHGMFLVSSRPLANVAHDIPQCLSATVNDGMFTQRLCCVKSFTLWLIPPPQLKN